MIRKGKDCYRRKKMEHQLQQNNICGVWKGLKTISGFKEPKSQPVGDQGWANDLNLFFNRFDQASAPPPAQSPLLLQPPSCSVTPVHCSSCAPSPLSRPSVHTYHSPPLTTLPQFTPTLSSHLPQFPYRHFHFSHSVLCTLPPINTSLLQPAPHNTPGEECPEEEQGQESSSRSGWHQLQAPEVLRRPAVWDFWVHIQPEPEAGESATTLEDVLHRPSAKDTAPQGAQQLQAGSSDVSSDEDAGETGPRPSAPAAQAAGDKLQLAGVDHHLTTWILDYLTHRPQFVRVQGFESDRLLCSTGAPQGTVLAPFLFTLYTADFSYNTPSCHLQKFSDDSAVVGLITDGDDREYRGLIQGLCGLVPAEQPPDQRW
ncbi:hypothetical protein L3Q82_020893 [Scortum barcoo]|uniref:Uncharacterized protein n=1 Tax=Scortum barcoo TaxID=214431 RepID=A0ACB8V8R2_9TELE|nr:hypothetical protein L3Q82_020893 [Scortum barcoo]